MTIFLVAINIALVVFVLLKMNKTDFSFLTADISNATKPISDKLIQLETIMVQRFEGQKEITKFQVSEIIEEKFKKITAEQNQSTQDIVLHFSKFQQAITAQMVSMNEKINKDLQLKLNEISDRVKENLDQGFKKTNETFNNVVERLAKIDEAQKKIESLSANVVSLQDVLTDKKSRGIFGEVQLTQVLNAVFGDKNDKVFQLQYKLPNGTICDSIIFLPEPTGSLVVDSKFPLENFRRMFDASYTDAERKEFVKDFKTNLKKHIDDIATKYIIRDVTADQAVLFLPAEAIFAELYAYHGDIIEYAHQRKVWITSPTTFMAMITTVQVVLNNIERSKYTNVIHQELNRLADEFSRYKKRWDALASHIDTVSKDVKEIHITTGKITDRFEHISEVKIDKLLE
ncbi:MAG: DNA recombination protein RmuC [Bacteriovorax sp.]|nr:DNA recombination protein RmuC [Bacteriovorax sp.]